MRILFVVEHFYPYVGGAEELFLNLTTSLVSLGHDVNVVTTLHDNSLQKKEEYRGVKITRVRCHNRFLFTALGLPEILKQAKKADFIHTTSYNSAVPSFLAGLFTDRKVIITFHEVWGKLWFRLPFFPKWKLTGFYLFEWFILKLPFYRYVAVSDYTRNSLISHGIDEDKIIRIYNGLDYGLLKQYHHVPPEKFTICYFGRLGISKGIELLLDATQIFITRHPESKLKLIIPTYPRPLFNKVISTIEKLSLKNNIILLHNLSKGQLLEEVSAASCVIIPSHSEGFCFVAVESSAIGVPVISSGKGSLPEVVSGKTISIKDLTVDGVLQALEKALLNDWETVNAKNFDLKESIDSYLSMYQSISR